MPAPMSLLEYLRVDPCAVIMDAQPQLVWFIVHFGFDLARVRMPERVIEGFFANLGKFAGHDGIKRTRVSIDNDMEFGSIDLPQLASRFCECTWQVCPIGGGASQIQQKFSALLHHLVGLPKCIFEDAASRLILWQLASGCMESQEKPLYSLLY